MLFAIYDEVEVKLGCFFEMADERDSEVGHFEEIKVVHLLLHRIRHFCFYDLVFDEDLADCLLTTVQDVHLARQAAVLNMLDVNFHQCMTETHGLCYVVLGKMNLSIFLESDEI